MLSVPSMRSLEGRVAMLLTHVSLPHKPCCVCVRGHPRCCWRQQVRAWATRRQWV